MSHTPGPWTLLETLEDDAYFGHPRIVGANRICPGIVFSGLGAESEANYTLIIAAPDLLAALKDCCAALGGIKANHDAIPASAIAAIAKAEGR